MLIPLRQNELDKLIPSVATSNQFTSALGNPRKILQRIIISSMVEILYNEISTWKCENTSEDTMNNREVNSSIFSIHSKYIFIYLLL